MLLQDAIQSSVGVNGTTNSVKGLLPVYETFNFQVRGSDRGDCICAERTGTGFVGHHIKTLYVLSCPTFRTTRPNGTLLRTEDTLTTRA